MTSLLDLTSSADVTEDRFLEALNMPIADIEMKFLNISQTKRDRLAKVLGADDSEPATLIRKLKELRNIEDTLVTAAIKEKSDDSSSDSAVGDDLSDADTVEPGRGASKQANDDKSQRRATLDKLKITDLRELLGFDTKTISKAKNAPAEQKYYKHAQLVDMIMRRTRGVVE